MKKIVQGWLIALLIIGLLATLERLAFELTGNELVPLNQGIDLILTVSCLLIMFFLLPYQSFRNRSRLNPDIIGWLLLGSFIIPLLVFLLVTATVNDLDGGLLLLLSAVVAPVITGVPLAILGLYQKLRSCGPCECHHAKHAATPAQ